MANLKAGLGDVDSAREYFQACFETFSLAVDTQPEDVADYRDEEARCLLDAGHLREALDTLGIARDIRAGIDGLSASKLADSEARPGDRNLAESLLELAKSAFAMHRLDISERALSRALEMFAATEGKEARATLSARFQRATTYRALGRLVDAESELTALLEAYGRGDFRLDQVRTTIELAKTVRDRGGRQPARELLDSCRARSATGLTLRTKRTGTKRPGNTIGTHCAKQVWKTLRSQRYKVRFRNTVR